MLTYPNSRRVVSPSSLANSSNNMSKSIIASWLFGLLFVASAIALVAQFRQVSALKLENYNLQEEKKLSSNKREINNDSDLTARLQELILLPADQPTIATVKDLAVGAQRSAFLANAENGDKMVIFRDRALLFRPSIDKIINMVGSGNFSELPINNSSASSSPAIDLSSSPSSTSSESSSSNVAVQTLEIRNGTAVAGQAKVWQAKMTTKGYKVLAIGNAANSNYTETTLINLAGKDVSKLEQELGVSAVNNLAGGEATSQADAIIIIGAK